MALDQGTAILDDAYREVLSGNVVDGLETARCDLLRYRAIVEPQDWLKFAKQLFPLHPFRELVHQSPFAWRAYHQPRGYPGDAVTLDYIYGCMGTGELTPLGQRLHQWCIQTQSCRSVRARKDVLTGIIDEVAASVPGANIFSVGCGHLREARASHSFRAGDFGSFKALDQDLESLALLTRELAGSGVEPIQGSVRSLVTGATRFENLDLVYAAGLYDYLSESTASRLTRELFSMLRSGGRLVVVNFHPDLEDIGGLETMMGWWLLYRTEHQVAQFASQIAPEAIASARLYRDIHRNLVFLDLRKA